MRRLLRKEILERLALYRLENPEKAVAVLFDVAPGGSGLTLRESPVKNQVAA